MTERAVTDGPAAHFVGYDDGSPWDPEEETLLVHEVEAERRPGPEDVATVCRVDGEGSVETVANTLAWNFQQGSMCQWLPGAEGERVVFNDRSGSAFVSRVLDVTTGEEREVPWPVMAVAPDGETAYSLDFTRLSHVDPGHGYALPAGTPDVEPSPAPAGDGLYRVDLDVGRGDLLVSLDDLAGFDGLDQPGAVHWVNDVRVAPGGERVAFRHHWAPEDDLDDRSTRLFVASPDGDEVRCLAGPVVGGYDWATPSALVAWTESDDRAALRRYDLVSGAVDVFDGPDLGPGRPAVAPDGRRVAVDAPDGDARTLSVLDTESGEVRRVGRFAVPDADDPALDCPLRPRWDRDGSAVCFDALAGERRQVHVADVDADTESR